MWHVFPRGEHMEIESLGLDFQPYKYQTKTQNISERKKKKKNSNKERRTQIREKRERIWRNLTAHLTSVAWGWRGLGSHAKTGRL